MRLRTLLIVDGCLITAGLWAATQWGAYRLSYHPALGWCVPVGAHRLYVPWQVLLWAQRFPERIPDTLHQAYGIMAGTLIVVVLFTAIMRWRRGFKVRPVGQDRWGTIADIRAAGLLA